jgi:hypothetical protein
VSPVEVLVIDWVTATRSSAALAASVISSRRWARTEWTTTAADVKPPSTPAPAIGAVSPPTSQGAAPVATNVADPLASSGNGYRGPAGVGSIRRGL